jgi:ABC-type nickel/cobalt efflux system permease component RcnA
METQVTVTVVVVITAIILVAFGVWYYYRRMTSKRLKKHFGPEYDQTVKTLHSQDRAEAELKQRKKRVSNYKIVSLPGTDRAKYRETWMSVQGQFVDQPEAAVADANRLVQEVMHKCGYPVANFEQLAADLSVDHPDVVENYRSACRIAERSRRGAADTEELRKALVYYRALFDDLLGDEEPRLAKGRRSLDSKPHKARAHLN